MEQDELDSLDYNKIQTLYDTFSAHFNKLHYLQERYSRATEFNNMMAQPDDVEMNITCAYEKMLVDTAAGYGMNKPVSSLYPRRSLCVYFS